MISFFSPAYGPSLRHEFNVDGKGVFFTDRGQEALRIMTRRFLDMGNSQGLSIDTIVTNTYRASSAHMDNADEANRIAAGIAFEEIRKGHFDVKVAGSIGPRGDGYKGDFTFESAEHATEYHVKQARILAREGVSYLIAETMGNSAEAIGIAEAAKSVRLPVHVSVILTEQGNVLDYTPIEKFIHDVDTSTAGYPAGYMANCSRDAEVEKMLARAKQKGVLTRISGAYNNPFDAPKEERDHAHGIKGSGQGKEYAGWLRRMLRQFPELERNEFKISGCCGHTAKDIAQVMYELYIFNGHDGIKNAPLKTRGEAGILHK